MTIVAAALMSAVTAAAFAQTTPSTNGNTPAATTPDSQTPTVPVEGAKQFHRADRGRRLHRCHRTQARWQGCVASKREERTV